MAEVGAHHLVMIDRPGRDEGQLSGLTDTNKRAIIPDNGLYQMGDFVLAKCHDATQNTLFCNPIEKMGIHDYFNQYGKNRF
jgi:ADP-glucose pyrophosphorylase